MVLNDSSLSDSFVHEKAPENNAPITSDGHNKRRPKSMLPPRTKSQRKGAFTFDMSGSKRSLISMDSRRSLASMDSKRSLISWDSVQSILDDSDDEWDEEEKNGGDTFALIKEEVVEEARQVNRKHVSLIQQNWRKVQEQDDYRKKFGSKLMQSMMEHDKTSRVSMGIAAFDSIRFHDLCIMLVDTMEHIILYMLGTSYSEHELADKSEEWLDEGVDARLVYKALIRCLEETLDGDDYSFEAAEAWETTFRDVLHKMAIAF